MKAGDRFERTTGWYVLEALDNDRVICVDVKQEHGDHSWMVGQIERNFQFVEDHDMFKYLGNFSKSSNFSNLYSILCE